MKDEYQIAVDKEADERVARRYLHKELNNPGISHLLKIIASRKIPIQMSLENDEGTKFYRAQGGMKEITFIQDYITIIKKEFESEVG